MLPIQFSKIGRESLLGAKMSFLATAEAIVSNRLYRADPMGVANLSADSTGRRQTRDQRQVKTVPHQKSANLTNEAF